MKHPRYILARHEDTLECFTHFRMSNRICRKYCAVRLRCLIERDQRILPEFFDDDPPIFDEPALPMQ